MKAVILVGGQGTRLRPLTLTCPKPLLPIVNQPFLERQLTWLGAYGVDDVVLSMGYLPDAFRDHFPDGRFGDLRLHYAVEDEPLGTAGAVRFAAGDEDGDTDEPVVVCNGDVLTDLDLGALLRLHAERSAAATITLSYVDDPSAFGVVPTAEDGEVQAFVEKPPRDEAPTHWINAGTYVLEPEVLRMIPAERSVSIERETFPELLEQPGRLYALEADAYWLDMGTPAMYLRAHADVAAGTLGSPPAPGAVERSPGVWIQGVVELDAAASLVGPLVVGDATTVGADSMLRHSSIGAGVTIGESAVVEDSVVLDGVTIGAGSRVSGSILGPSSGIGDGATVADESVVGAGATIRPGTQMSAERVPAPAV